MSCKFTGVGLRQNLTHSMDLVCSLSGDFVHVGCNLVRDGFLQLSRQETQTTSMYESLHPAQQILHSRVLVPLFSIIFTLRSCLFYCVKLLSCLNKRYVDKKYRSLYHSGAVH
jgi:hypothetical protein